MNNKNNTKQMITWNRILEILDKTPKPIKWMFTRVGRVITLAVISAILFATSQIPSISYDANEVLFYTSISTAVYPLLAALWYITNGLVINPIISLIGEDNKNPTLNKIVKTIRKIQFKIR